MVLGRYENAGAVSEHVQCASYAEPVIDDVRYLLTEDIICSRFYEFNGILPLGRLRWWSPKARLIIIPM